MAIKQGHIIIAVAGVLLLITLVVTIAVIATAKHGENVETTCHTPGCIRSSMRIIENMNEKIDPCDNFYKFACGRFDEITTIPDDKTSVTTFSAVQEILVNQLRAIVDVPSKANEPRSFKVVKNLYKTCMNTSAIEKSGLNPLRKILLALGKWPVLESSYWNERTFDWVENVYKSLELGYGSYFVRAGVGVDLKNSTKRVIQIDHPDYNPSRESLSKGLDDPKIRAYLNYMVDIAEVLGANRARAREELRESLRFEIGLANISLSEQDRMNLTRVYNLMSISDMNAKYPSINWTQYINRLLSLPREVDDREVVMVIEPGFIRDFENLIRRTTKRAQANYALWKVIQESVSFLTEDLRTKQQIFSTAVTGERERGPRWKECIDVVSQGMAIGTGALYVRKYFTDESKKKAVEMTNDLKKEMIKLLKQAEWMDETTRDKAMKKAVSMFDHTGYPDEFLDDKKLEEFHANLELKPDNFLGNVRNLTRFANAYSVKDFDKPLNKSNWIDNSQAVIINAYYNALANSIQLPAGILQETFFSSDRPQYLNYGAIGFIIGHEITHGFDTPGREFDQEGNMANWWAPETIKKYLKKAECMIYQYGNYTVESVGLKVNGILTLGENIADNGGIKEAYYAYKEWVKRNGPEPKLPGLDYTPEQMYWISAANNWCSKHRPEMAKIRIETDDHCPEEFRVIGPFSNSPEFAADFKCPTGSAMNPKEKCSVW